jgi:outer membrane protein assembly factor BamB
LNKQMKMKTGKTIKHIQKCLAFGTLIFALAGCETVDEWFSKPTPPLPGKRISVMVGQRAIQPDARLKDKEILLPPPTPNAEWPQAGGYASHAMHHVQAGDALKPVWKQDIGDGSGDEVRLIASPIVANGQIFTIDAVSEVRAYSLKTGQGLWSHDVTPKKDNDGHMPGGIAYENGRVFVATGFAEAIALDARNGKTLWRRNLGGPMRAAPTVRGGRVFVITLDNKLHALSAKSGKVLWTFTGVGEVSSLLGSASPAVDSGIVVAPFSSGELVALRVNNGQLVWSGSLSKVRRSSASISTLSHIRGRPVIDRGRVFAVSHGGVFGAFDLRSGRRLWDRPIGSHESPWVVGDYIFMLTNDSELIAISRNNGRVYWILALPRHVDNDIKKPLIIWTGPLLVSDRLIVAGSHGRAVAVSPYSGKVLGIEKMPDGVTVSPIVANRTIYFLTDDADLIAYR